MHSILFRLSPFFTLLFFASLLGTEACGISSLVTWVFTVILITTFVSRFSGPTG